MAEMNWDTNELWNWIVDSNEGYFNALKDAVGNEMRFMFNLYLTIGDINNRNENEELMIDSSKVNGNEIYVDFSELVGNEQVGWCRNEK